MYTINLRDVNKDQINLVGGKGANLGEMIQARFPVPQGFSITSSAYDEYIRSNRFDSVLAEYLAKMNSAPEKAQALALELMNILKAGTIPTEMMADIVWKYCSIGDNIRVAVRSSATAEDLPEASFAGQQDTYLNICGIDALCNAVKSCFASLWTERAIAYRKKTGFDKQKVSLAVVVQEMMEGDVAGVLFTANPINGNKEEMVINASYGLGESIVSGLVSPDTFYWDRNAEVVKEKILGSKETSIVYDSKNNTVEKANDPKSRNEFCIAEEELQSLISIGKQIESHYGYPQDIEWAIKDGKLYILQARGITTLDQKATSQKDSGTEQSKIERMLIDMMADSYPEPPYPLELAPICALFNGFSDGMKAMGVNLAHDPIGIKDNGEFAFKILTSGESEMPHESKPPVNFNDNIRYAESVYEKIRLQLTQMEAVDLKSLQMNAIGQILKKLMNIVERIITLRLQNIIGPNMGVSKRISDSLKTANLTFNEYDMLSGLHYKTWDMNVELSQLAEVVNGDAALKDLILNLQTDESLDHNLMLISKKFPVFGELYKRLLKEYGWKSTNSHQSFSASSWNEDRAFFITLLRVAMAQEKKLVESDKYDNLCALIKAALSPEKAMELQKNIEESRAYHQSREESVYLLEWCYGLSRLVLGEIVARTPQTFPFYADILYLSMEEVCSFTENNMAIGPEKIALRKQSQKNNQALWDERDMQSTDIAGGSLIGVSGSAGKAKGKVCVIHDISEFDKLEPGDILICKYTDPIWTPLFAIAKAVVSDTGGALSHSAIVAREYGIPAVMGCGNATKVLTDGQEIIVDGDKGLVDILT